MTVATKQPDYLEHPSEQYLQDLASAVEGALWRFDPIRQTNSRIAVTVEEGTAYLDGNIRGAMMKAVATRLAASVPGIRSVVNRLISDAEIERAVAMALAFDPELAITTDKVSIASRDGRVELGGRVFALAQADADASRERMEMLARGLAGVKDVYNAVDAIEGDESAFIVTADVAEADSGPARIAGPKNMGTLIPDPLKDKLRAMITARAEARAARG